MPNVVYFDTDVFHRIGETLHDRALAVELRNRILLSPITFTEVVSHLTLKQSGADVLRHIQAIHNWVNPKNARLLPWPTTAIAKGGFHKTLPDDSFVDQVERTINICLNATSVEQLRDSAEKLKDALDKMKGSTAQDLKRLVEAYREDPLVGEKFSELWVHGIAQRVHVDPASRLIADIVAAMSAYHEYECTKIKIAAENRDYDPAKHKNDLLDSEQLVYLADPTLHFLTCDRGYAKRVTKSEQAKRIHTVSVEELAEAERVEALLAEVTN